MEELYLNYVRNMILQCLALPAERLKGPNSYQARYLVLHRLFHVKVGDLSPVFFSCGAQYDLRVRMVLRVRLA